MNRKCLTSNERKFAEQHSEMISEFLLGNGYNYDDYYGDAAIGFLQAVQFCFQFSVFSSDQFKKIAELFMRESVKPATPNLEIVNLDDFAEEAYWMEEDITEQTIRIAAEHFMNAKIVEHLLLTADLEEKKIMELIYNGVPNSQILQQQGISQNQFDSMLTKIRNRLFAA